MTEDGPPLYTGSRPRAALWLLRAATLAGICSAMWFGFVWFQAIVPKLLAHAEGMTVDAFQLYEPLWLFGANNIAVGLTAIVLYVGVHLVERRSFRALLSSDGHFRFGLFARGFLVWAVSMAAVHVVLSAIGWRAPLKVALVPGFGILLLVAATFLIQAPVEELIFRGYLRSRLAEFVPDRLHLRVPISVLVSAMIFAALHFYHPAGTAQMFVLGLGCSLVRLADGRLERAMGLHASLNVMIAVVFGLNGSTHRNWPSLMRLPPAPRADWVDVVQLALTFALMLLVSYGIRTRANILAPPDPSMKC